MRRELEVEERARSSFFITPLGLIIGLALFYGADIRAPLSATAALAALLGGAFLISRPGTAWRPLWLVALAAACGMLLAHAELARTHTTIFSGEATVRIEGRVKWRDIDDRSRVRYVLDILSTERPVLSRPPERVRIVVTSRHALIPVGGTYVGLVRLRPPSGPAFPGAYDFSFVPFFQGLGAYGFSLGAPEPFIGEPQDLTFLERVARTRVAMAERIRGVVEGAEGAVASALVTGERAGIPAEVDEWLRITGLAHVLSISGFHMALIAGFTMLSVRAILSLLPAVPLLVSTKKMAALVALAVSTAYLLIAGDNVATQRSYIMLVIMLGAVLLDRPALTLRNVAIAAMIVIAISPHAVLTASFQMSFAATAALIGAYGALMRWWNRRRQRRAGPPRGVLAGAALATMALALSSLIAGGATAPYGVYHFQRAALLGGLIANVAIMPLFSFWIMPAALIAVLLMPFGLDSPVWQAMGHGLTLVFRMAEILAAWFPDRTTGLMTKSGLVLLSAAVLSLCFFASRLRWIALPLALVGLTLAPDRREPPELLIFEDGKQLALVGEEGGLAHLKERPNGFVDSQWSRAFPEAYPREENTHRDTSPGAFTCTENICRATTRSGLRVGWTEDYEKTGLLCDTTDVAIVSRAIRLSQCRSGAHLVTLRSLRRTGSLAVSADPQTGRAVVTPSIAAEPREWNRHRHAPWPEFWRNPERDASASPRTATAE
ncbi:ComEC/Rec2 family competence protein [Aureimonas populi]|uniref:ComEC/Rec2 family competence protein n=1 Tax=Aureimonas populi TaxID=1701758 RepID=A0ABW5CP85_9HYPH|nr:ComEC/Rec2 family competence protein [Aureimonas populi]